MNRFMTKTSFFGAVLALAAVMLAVEPTNAQYESFFSGESWEYSIDYLMTCYTKDYDPNAFHMCSSTYSFLFHHDDTLTIGGNAYYYLHDPDPFGFGRIYLREDIANGRLYARYDTAGDAKEYLLCDLSLSVGDTFLLPEGIWSVSGDKTMVVDSVSYLSGKKVVHLTLVNGSDFFFRTSDASLMEEYNVSLRFMEGIGPMFGICPTSAVSMEDNLGLLLCMHKDDTLCYMTHEILGCYQSGTDVSEYPQSFLHVFPIPADENVMLTFLTEEEVNGQVVIRDVLGRVHIHLLLTCNNAVLNLSSLPQGIYLLTFIDGKGRMITKKLIKQ